MRVPVIVGVCYFDVTSMDAHAGMVRLLGLHVRRALLDCSSAVWVWFCFCCGSKACRVGFGETLSPMKLL